MDDITVATVHFLYAVYSDLPSGLLSYAVLSGTVKSSHSNDVIMYFTVELLSKWLKCRGDFSHSLKLNKQVSSLHPIKTVQVLHGYIAIKSSHH